LINFYLHGLFIATITIFRLFLEITFVEIIEIKRIICSKCTKGYYSEWLNGLIKMLCDAIFVVNQVVC